MLPASSAANQDRYPMVPMLFGRNSSWLMHSTMCALFLLTPTLSQSDSAPPPTQVRGEVLMLTSELIVVKSAEGTSILIPLRKYTTVDASLKVGDQVEVVATQDQQASLVKKVTSDPPR